MTGYTRCFTYLILILVTMLFSFSCSTRKSRVGREGYRFVSFQTVPRDRSGKITGNSYWTGPPNYIKGSVADSFYLYHNYDSIRFMPAGSPSVNLFKKANIKAKSWKPELNYGDLLFIGNYRADHLPGMYMSFYIAKDKSTILEAYYTNPGNLTDVILFHKDSVNVLEKNKIIVDAKKEEAKSKSASFKPIGNIKI